MINLKHGIVFAGKVLLVGFAQELPEPEALHVRDSRGASATVLAPRVHAVGSRPRAADRLAGATGFIVEISVLDVLNLDFERGGWSATLELADGSAVTEPDIRVKAVDPRAEAGPTTERSLLEIAFAAGIYEPQYRHLFDPATLWRAPLPESSLRVEYQFLTNFGQLLIGWAANLGQRRLTFLSGDFVSSSGPDETLGIARPEVSALLAGAGVPASTHAHGFYVSLPRTSAASRTLFVLEETPGGAWVHGPVDLAPVRNDDLAVLALSILNRGARWPKAEVAERFFKPFFLPVFQPNRGGAAEVYAPGGAPPRVSVVVPFYGETRFIRSVLAMQLVLPHDYEWILVCDDPAIAPEIEAYLWSRRASLRHRTLLVRNHLNYGFAAANNIGVSKAGAPVVVLMNSDVWVDDPAPLETAVEAVASGAFDLVGMRLHYEDGTVQHDEIVFERSALVGGLYLASHMRKGLPSPPGHGVVRDVVAVTGALMVIGRDAYERWGGLSEDFIRGDFEDADLCLRIVAGGGRVGIVDADGVYHLERQSIGLTASEGARAAVTQLNCLRFNERWGAFLDEAPRQHADP